MIAAEAMQRAQVAERFALAPRPFIEIGQMTMRLGGVRVAFSSTHKALQRQIQFLTFAIEHPEP